MAGDSDLLFVYGSLLSGSSHPMAQQLAANATLLGQAHIRGHRYRIDWYTGVVPSETAGTVVTGEVYRLYSPGTLLPVLDAYEEAEPWRGTDAEFRRELLPVELAAGGRLCCWVYSYNRPVIGLERI